MQFLLLGSILIMASSVTCQSWNNQSPGITVKTLYVPMPKGSSSIPVPDFSQIRPLATLNLPSVPTTGELQLASTLNQNFRPKVNVYQQNVQPLQDVRVKLSQQPFKVLQQNNIHQVPNIQSIYQNSNFNQQQVNNAHHLQQAAVQHLQGLQQFYQPEILAKLTNTQPQNVVYIKNNSLVQLPNNGYSNGNAYIQNIPANGADGRLSQTNNAYGHQTYAPENILSPRQPASNSIYTQYQIRSSYAPHTVQSFQHKNNVNQVSLPITNNEGKYSAQSSRYFQQFSTDKSTTQQPYTSSPNENTSHSPNQQVNYGVQNSYNVQQMDDSIRNTNPFQGFAIQSNQQAQQPVNTYAIVHQRVPTNDIRSQGLLQSDQSYSNAHNGQAPDENSSASHETYANNEQSDYIKTTHNQEQDVQHSQGTPQSQLNSQNTLENSQYQEKQVLSPVSVNTQQYHGHPVLSHVQVMMSQYRQNQQDSSEGQYQNHQKITSGIRDTQSQDISSNQAPNSVSNSPYSDQVSETYYPTNKQVYVSPPSDYSSQAQQQPTPRELGYVRYSSPTETGSQSAVSVQNSQVPQSNSNYGYQDSSQYNNAYVQ